MTVVHAAALDPVAVGPLAKGGEAVKAGPVGLGVILLLCIACYFLFKSMSRHLRNVRENFPVDEPPPAAPQMPTAQHGAPPMPPAPHGPAHDPPSNE